MPQHLRNMAGLKFGTLVVLERADGVHEARWLCRCECGLERIYVGGKLRRGDAKCKCARGKDRNGDASAEPDIHRVWKNMRDRCSRPASKSYPRYGGRGIKVCREWTLSFSSFCKWAKDNGWQKGLQIDRVNNDGNYEPLNCRFVERSVNLRNKSSSRIITYLGETRALVEWAEVLGIPSKVLSNRINKQNWTIERAFSTPQQSVADAARARTPRRKVA